METKAIERIIISGGGTGGHIFPALSIADEVRRRYPKARILFVGAKGRMEAEKVPAAGYEIMVLPVTGLARGGKWYKNFSTFWHLLKSISSVHKLMRNFRPQVAVGVGGYASAPTLMAAQLLGIPTLVQEQNSYAGVTNKLVGRRAKKICVAYEGMERFFPKGRIALTGNPVRKDLLHLPERNDEAYHFFGLTPGKKTILILGGSLGARTMNESVEHAFDELSALDDEVQVLWQTGKSYEAHVQEVIKRSEQVDNIHPQTFIYRMDLAFAIADLVISRAGAGSISEFSLLGLPVILVPSPNVAEDHQTKNAMALVHKEAALMVRDSEARDQLIPLALKTVRDEAKLNTLRTNIKKMGLPHSAEKIVDYLEEIIKR